MRTLSLERAGTIAGFGLLAGLIGATVMLGSQKAEMALTGRAPSDTPAKAVEQLTGIDPDGAATEQTLSTAGHFAFGTGLGLGLALLDDVPEPARGALFFAGAWSLGTAVITGLGLSEPPTKWTRTQLATDLGHHLVYAASAAAAFAGLRRLAPHED